MILLRQILGRLYMELLYWPAYAGLLARSAWRSFQLGQVQPTILSDAPCDEGRPVLLLALYQKGSLRADTRRLIAAAREAGYFVMGVNTQKLAPGGSDIARFDAYLERVNFGRDFASYRAGFLHVFSKGWHQACSRLVMMNDSVFVSSQGLARFLSDMRDAQVEVLGATENYEVEYHLGSFCISIAPSILEQPEFRRYWQDYRLTDVRPKVILRGEMRLSRLLKRLVSSPEQFTALYSAERFTQMLVEDDTLVEFALRNGRTSSLTHWKRVCYDQLVPRLQERVDLKLAVEWGSTVAAVSALERFENDDEDPDERIPPTWRRRAIERLGPVAELDPEAVRRIQVGVLSDVFIEGSQIHQNAAVMLQMGLPIVKLDGLYRGMFNLYDVGTICSVLPEQERRPLRALLIERPFGADTYTGWKRAAFLRGLI